MPPPGTIQNQIGSPACPAPASGIPRIWCWPADNRLPQPMTVFHRSLPPLWAAGSNSAVCCACAGTGHICY